MSTHVTGVAANGTSAVPSVAAGDTSIFLHRYTLVPSALRQWNFDDVSSWPDDPMRVFNDWYSDAERMYQSIPAAYRGAVNWPNTMSISTRDRAGGDLPVRTVLLKQIVGTDTDGVSAGELRFFTNYNGAKGSQLTAHAHCGCVFYWKTLEKQVRVVGSVRQLSAAENDDYFHSRPVGSQISAAVSPQSQSIGSPRGD